MHDDGPPSPGDHPTGYPGAYPSAYPSDSSWYGDRRPHRPVTAGTLHLCPACRDLMSEVVRTARLRPDPPPEPEWARALRWLDAVCGGRAAVMAFDTVPLSASASDGPDGPDWAAVVPAGHRQRLESCLALLAAAADRFFDSETGTALARGLWRVHEREPGVVVGARSASQLALGVIWAVGRANGLLHPRGVVTEKQLKPYLNATQSGSTLGHRVRDALVGPYEWEAPDRPFGYGSDQTRDLEPLGHVDLLVSSVRRQLLEVRERALAAEATAGASV